MLKYDIISVMPHTYSKLVVVRHGESEWSVQNKWTGHADSQLTQQGFRDAYLLGKILLDIPFDYAYCSQRSRTHDTLKTIMQALGNVDMPYEVRAEFNEQDFGDYTGKNKNEVKQNLGTTAYRALSHGWNVPFPGGESLKSVYNRLAPYYVANIVPKLNAQQTVLIVSHSNAIRALIKYIESVSDEDIARIKINFGEAIVYHVDQLGKMKSKQLRHIPIL